MESCTLNPDTSKLEYITCMPGPLWPIQALGVRSAGIGKVAAGWRHARGHVADRANVYWGGTGTIRFRADGAEHELHGGEIIYFPPGHFMAPSLKDSEGQYCWMTLCGPLAVAILEYAGLHKGQSLPATKCPEDKFRQLLELLRHPSPDHARIADLLAYDIILSADIRHSAARAECGYSAREARACIDKHFTDCDFNVDALAVLLRRHRTGISRSFKAAYSLSPGEYIHEKRLMRAAILLQSHDWNLERVAYACGFRDPGYFSRCFRRRYHLPPGAFRQKQLSESI